MSAPAYQASCDSCGAPMTYDPAAVGLACDHCKATKALAVTAVDLLPYDSWKQQDDATEEVFQVTCEGCGASTTLPPRVTTGTCPFCARTFVAPPSAVQRIRPGGVLPMSVAHPKAVEAYKAWIGSRWFAPNDLKASAVAGAFAAVHVPSWRFDAHATTQYTGQRGEDRTEHYTETYTDSDGNTQTRQESRTVTDWYSASGSPRPTSPSS